MSPTFQNQFYSFAIKSNEFGKVGDVLATSLSPEAVIAYSIASENGNICDFNKKTFIAAININFIKAYLMARLTIDSSTGEIFSLEELNSGYYEAEVIAKTTIDDEELQDTTLVKKN